MARKKRQTRRCISIKGQTYCRLRNYAERSDTPIAGLIEQWVAERLEQLGEPEVDRRIALAELDGERLRRTPPMNLPPQTMEL